MAQIDEIYTARLEKLEAIKKLGWDPYVSKFDKKNSIAECLTQEGKKVTTAGKVMSFRTHGNICFADLKDSTGKIQIFFKKDLLGAEKFKNLKYIDIGDYIGVEGEVMKTTAGEISIAPVNYTLLTKSLLPLPHEWYGLKDVETRFRQRYLDLLMNQEVRERFNIRSKLVRYLREFLDNRGFWEVETPVLQPLYGGANARPFTTHYHALDTEMYLSIASELYLKRLIVGGYEKVYDIGHDFRNEGVDRTHSPEFTMLETYESYADYHQVMDMVEALMKYLAQKVLKSTDIHVDDRVVDIGKTWPRIRMVDILQEKLGLEVEKMSSEELFKYCKANNIETIGGETKGQLIFSIFDEKITPDLIEPTFIIDYPADVSPLSKSHFDNPEWVQRFEGYIGGKEICDGWSEINDPQVQRLRLTKDEKAVHKANDAQVLDEDFLTAMEYGMPPFGGLGLGIDRLTMFFTNTWSIREVMWFPMLRPEKLIRMEKETDIKIRQGLGQKLTIQRKEALEILNLHIKSINLINHCKSVEAAMGALGMYFELKRAETREDENIDIDKWKMAGLLHDADWEETQPDFSQHTLKTVEWIKQAGENDEELLECILTHNYSHNGFRQPESDMEWSLYTCDELTGFIVAIALIRPDKKLASVTVESILKKFSSAAFAKPVNRSQIKMCEDKLGIPLEKFVEIVLRSMQDISDEIGL